MSSTSEKPKSKTFLRRTRRRQIGRTSSRRRLHARSCRDRRSCFNNGGRTCSEVSGKLEALKNLIPAGGNGAEIIKPDQLFQETAEYIILLRTRVVMLQRLLEFYGSSGRENVVL
ncbi:hypothetical protein I3760_03G082900 [Carya illinoinensis]|uniref:Uncharacterized protein n=1 Tax=Carya illinoinensis TaxID=32201 RepID=A0A8T1R1J2_CARIL|nr:hypothetical protein I3760_03G082900 [Carya illinoinensis]KAG6660204.1 hypothetical protein CIPAW_03G089400 [Carya illinoinensis]KAG6720890.1 hypothetical protein I3842_03G085300 [Carya illinoinensis]